MRITSPGDGVQLSRAPQFLLASLRGRLEVWVAVLVILTAAGFMLSRGVGFSIGLMTLFTLWGMLAISLNLVLGYTGLLSVGHIGFYGIGAYTVAVLTTNPRREFLGDEVIQIFAWPFFAALPVAVLLTGVIALFVGLVFSRFRDDLYVLASFGFAIISLNVFVNWQWVTRGPFGIHEIPKPAIGGFVFNDDLEFLALALFFLAVVAIIAWLIVTSSFGRVLKAVREDEDAVEVFGYRASHYKLAVWVISAMMAALAGAVFASYTSFVDPHSFILLESIILVAIVILGGLASIPGALLGALSFVLLEEGIRFIPLLPPEHVGQARQIILGVLLILLMLFRPQGVAGRFKL